MRNSCSLLPTKTFYRICPELYQASKTVSGTLVRIQLLGQHLQWLAENAARAVELGSWGMDFNSGCPSPTVNGHGGGETLLKPEFGISDSCEKIKIADLSKNILKSKR